MSRDHDVFYHQAAAAAQRGFIDLACRAAACPALVRTSRPARDVVVNYPALREARAIMRRTLVLAMNQARR